MEKDWKTRIEELDQTLRQGRHTYVRQELSKINAREVPRESLQSLANVARRAGAFSLALRLLNPVCRPSPGIKGDASSSELAEYGMALVKNGSLDEAIALFKGIDARREPRTLLYQAFARFPRWEYAEALPLLESFIARVDAGIYEHRIAEVNRLAALIFLGREEHATELSRRLLELTERDSQRLLHANVLELSAQLAIRFDDFEHARKRLSQARALLAESPVGDRLFIDKWNAVILLADSRGLEIQPLEQVRKSASWLGHWETLRDCDFHEARYRLRPDLFARIFHGTPHPAYRERLLETLRNYGTPTDTHIRIGKSRSGASILDLRAATWRDGDPLFKAGGVEHRLLLQLNRDFYKPERIGSLFAAVYPDEYFNPVSSPLRVHQALKRLRRTLRVAKVPLQIRESGHQYFLIPGEGCALRCVSLEGGPAAHDLELRFRPLEACFGNSSVSARELSRKSGLSVSTVTRLLNEAREAGWIQCEGNGPARRYRRVSLPAARAA